MSSVPDMDTVPVSLHLAPTSHRNLNSKVRITYGQLLLADRGAQLIWKPELCCLSIPSGHGTGSSAGRSGHTWLQDLLPGSLLWLLIIGIYGTH